MIRIYDDKRKLSNSEILRKLPNIQKKVRLQYLIELVDDLTEDEYEKLLDYAHLLVEAHTNSQS